MYGHWFFVPLIAFLGLMYLGVTLSPIVSGRDGGFDEGGIDQCALLHHDTHITEPLVDGLEELAGQLCCSSR